MSFVVECVRGGPDGEHFDLSYFAWEKLIPLAEAHGWKPEGTTYEPWPVRRHAAEGRPSDYQPDEWLYATAITTTDARELAKALRAATATCGNESEQTLISEPRGQIFDDKLSAIALALAHYCEGGGFLFAVDD